MIRLIFAILISAVALAAQAQSKIDNLIEKLEKKNDVETTYTERRTPSRQLYKVSKIMTFRDNGYYNQLVKAFEDERENSVSAVKTSGQITYKFQNKKGTSTYTLTREAPYSLIMTWRSSKVKGDDDAFNDATDGNSTMIILGNESLCNNDCDDSNLWQAIAGQISDISAEMSTLDLSRKSDCRRYMSLDRKRAKLQKRLAGMNSYQVDLAREQAREAREQAAIARRQAEQAREEARKAHKEAQRQARYASSNSTTTIYYNY